MPTSFCLVVHGGPFSSEASYSALNFARACLASGHTVHRVFFYQDGINNGNALLSPPQDEHNTHEAWHRLGQEHDLDLVVCIAAAARRGVINQQESQRHNKIAHNLPDGFTLSGLGQLVEACASVDRVINFGVSD